MPALTALPAIRSTGFRFIAPGVLCVLHLLMARTSAQAPEFHVSPGGNDLDAGTAAEPFATLDRARLAVRAVNAGMTGDVVVHLAPGDYPVSGPVSFDAADSGRNGHRVIYRASGAPGSARLVGGQRVTGWQPWQGQIVFADVGGAAFHTLYENGKRARKARFPNLVPDASLPLAKSSYLRATGTNGSRTQLTYAAGALAPDAWNLAGAQIHMWSGGKWSWFTDTVPIASVNAATRTITFAEDVRYPVFQNSVGSRFFVQGVLALLDEPGEFHYDAQAGRLYYWPMDGPAAEQEIIVPRTRRILSLAGGSASDRVRNLRFEGLGVEFTDFTGWFRHAYPLDGGSGIPRLYPQFDRQATMPQHREAAVFLENTESITFDACVIRNTGYSGVMSYGANRQNAFQKCWVSHAGMHGFFFEGLYPGEGDVQTQNTVDNCLIQDVGEQAGHGAAVQLTNASNHEISHSVLDRGTRYAFCSNAYIDIPQADMYAHGNRVHHLRITNFAQDSGDIGAVNSWGISDDLPYLVNFFEQLIIENTRAHPSMTDFAPNGMFLDNDTNGQVLTDIEIRNSQGAAFRLNESGSHSLTNVSWQSGFDSSRMAYSSIGVRGDHPFAVAPIRLAGQRVSSGVFLSWLPVANAASYTLWSAPSASGPWQVLASGIATPSHIDSSPQTAVRHYRVTSVGPLGNQSEASSSIAVQPPATPGTVSFETVQGYGIGSIGALNGGAANTITDAPFTGLQGWSLSTSNATGAITAASSSGEYEGGQALTSVGSNTYIGGKLGIVKTAATSTISFDAMFSSAIQVGFLGDNGNGLFDQNVDTGMQFGFGGSPIRVQYRPAGFGSPSVNSPGNPAFTSGDWYRFNLLIGPGSGGNREITMSLRNLTTAADVDLNGTAAGNAWTFTVTDVAFGVAPEDAVGGFARITTSASRIDNLLFTAAPRAGSYAFWAMTNATTGDANDDFDDDGVSNGVEYVLGGTAATNDFDKLPAVATSGGNMTSTFIRSKTSANALVSTVIEAGTTLAGWPTVYVVGANTAASSAGVTVTDRGDGTEAIQLTVPQAPDTRKFARLKVTVAE
jgi:hypothetical protein